MWAINSRLLSRLVCLTLLIVASLLLASCRRGGGLAETAVPTVTVTPFSTPLPPAPTAVAVGAEDNPIRMLLRPSGSLSAASSSASTLEEILEEETGLAFDVETVSNPADLLNGLCDSSLGQVSVAWVDGVTYQAVRARECGEPMLQIEREGDDDPLTGEVVLFLTRAEDGVAALADLSGDRIFCRVSATDLYSWVVPSMYLQANGVRPTDGLSSVIEFETPAALVEALLNDQCDVIALAQSDYERVVSRNERDEFETLAETLPVPFGILVYPEELPLGGQQALAGALFDLAEDEEQVVVLETLFDAVGLAEADTDSFNAWRNFGRSTGLDFAILGTE